MFEIAYDMIVSASVRLCLCVVYSLEWELGSCLCNQPHTLPKLLICIT